MDFFHITDQQLYQSHSGDFTDDLDFYLKFCQGHSTLELFAGYGRVSNHLSSHGVELETVEISPFFSDQIQLPSSRKHVCDVRTFSSPKRFSRLFAAYNSFCLFTNDVDLRGLFRLIDQHLEPGGRASLNYYHPDYWGEAVEGDFELNGQRVNYIPAFDLSRRNENQGIWTDIYSVDEGARECSLSVRIVEDERDLLPFLEGLNLTLIQRVENFNRDNVVEPGWIDFIFEKY
ncbi:hypothetical protein ONV78_13240 [Hahella sp. CR1]|uniref:hypothetical protein n=1 Tax=Hahella sp. CR1 TaxID=2992807 RepID=UPI002442C03B|nr:hypothetical protein [Hahella sp. CR1]MDG9668701.1 hypothetical protein [Hahella sp. CR1]